MWHLVGRHVNTCLHHLQEGQKGEHSTIRQRMKTFVQLQAKSTFWCRLAGVEDIVWRIIVQSFMCKKPSVESHSGALGQHAVLIQRKLCVLGHIDYAWELKELNENVHCKFSVSRPAATAVDSYLKAFFCVSFGFLCYKCTQATEVDTNASYNTLSATGHSLQVQEKFCQNQHGRQMKKQLKNIQSLLLL